MQQAYLAGRIFTGSGWLEDQVVVTEAGRIIDIIPKNGQVPEITEDLGPHLLIPAFIDAQVYGASGKLFSAYPEPSTLQLMQESFSRQGTCAFQPTVATNTMEVFRNCIDAVREYLSKGGQGVTGLHLEGPWIDPGKRGAHVKELVHAPGLKEVEEILEYGNGVITMITLAPEHCPDEVLAKIISAGVIVSAGHSNAGFQTAMAAFEKGIPAITHLYNAMSGLQHREPGMVGAAFSHDRVRASIIPDGIHVSWPAITIAKRIMGDRLFAITDAVTETTTGPYRHYLAGDRYESEGVLSGSAISMHQAMINLVQHAGVDKDEALRMCSLYPAQVLKCDDRLGRIDRGYESKLVVLDGELGFVKSIT
jgi:N-acetylglucosamine-6-phosphate deacetylase